MDADWGTNAEKIGDLLANDKDRDARRKPDDHGTRKHSDACSEAACSEKHHENAGEQCSQGQCEDSLSGNDARRNGDEDNARRGELRWLWQVERPAKREPRLQMRLSGSGNDRSS